MGNKRHGKVAFFTSNIFAVYMLIFLSKSGGRGLSPLPLPSFDGPGLKSGCSGPGANTSSTKVNAFSRLMGPKRKTQNRNKIGLITIG